MIEHLITLIREAGEVSKGCFPNLSTCTCVGKAVAKELIREYNEKSN